jgi:Ser-tRNA(Ala) deacylase AlaX
MNTHLLYYDDPSRQAFRAEALRVAHLRGNTYNVTLDETAFYPEGGGQPSDQGEISGPNGILSVKLVRMQEGFVLHEGTLAGTLEEGEEVEGAIKWPRRTKYMRIHTAGHLIHDVLMSRAPDLVAVKGRHGDKAFLEYRGRMSTDVQEALEAAVNEAAARNLPVKSWESSREELEELCSQLPPNLPSGKALRAIQIGTYEPMPDGGVHVASTGELGQIVIHHVTEANGSTMVRYGVK